MKKKEKTITALITILLFVLYIGFWKIDLFKNNADKLYNIYLDGSFIGVIQDKEELYELIDDRQQSIKDKYNVDTVYPPNGLKIVETYSYDNDIVSSEEIYKKIEQLQDFTIKGYEIKIGGTDDHEEYDLYVLNKDYFYDAMNKFILAFIPESDYNSYLKNETKELEDVGIIYKDLKILEEVTIRDKYISVNDHIYKSGDELAKTLLFGFDYEAKSYTVKAGDTVTSISDNNEINVKEFLIANTKYSSEDSLLTIGDEVKIAYVKPILNFQYSVNEIREVEYDYQTVTGVDKNKTNGEILTPGVVGLSKQTLEYTVKNGELNSDTNIVDEVSIREKVDQVVNKINTYSGSSANYYSETFAWPTVRPYLITSNFGYRSLGGGKQHNGIDISGSLYGTEIYAAADGIVVGTNDTCANQGSYPNSCGGGFGNYVYIKHNDSLYTVYAHMMKNVTVSVGQSVSKGQIIGYMGNSGQSTGAHLHFALSTTNPVDGGTYKNPLTLYSRK